jgi:SAM-dependent methyltransferase
MMGEGPSKNFDPLVSEYYDRAPEETRLQQGPFQLEEARTRELIQRFAPPPPGTVVDVGGAAGAYALWLAEAGYEVHLVDAAPRLVAEAQRRSSLAAGLALSGVYAVEGPGWILPDVTERMANPRLRAALLRVARMLETEPAVVGSSAHLLAVAQLSS